MRRNLVAVIAIASLLALVLSGMPARAIDPATYTTGSHIYLTSASKLWNVTIDNKSFVALQHTDAWVWECYVELDQYAGDPVGATERLEVTITINDGTNAPVVMTSDAITPSLTERVYVTCSIPSTSYDEDAIIANPEATITYLLENDTSSADLDEYVGVIRIDELEITGMVWVLIPTIIGLFMVIAMMGYFMDVSGSVMGASQGSEKRHSGKHKKAKGKR